MNISNSEKIQIAKDFVSLHKHDIEAWSPLNLHADQKYLQIYQNLVNSVYGGEEYYDSGEGYLCLEVEISQFDSMSGHTHHFEVEIEPHEMEG
tara:strand:- start:155 stop:433 length:279 start_codon:yes stop_codon:yes gene_type:complete